MYTYLLINFFTIFFPICLSFEKKVYFFGKWKTVFLAGLPVALIFLVWDYFFTVWGVWGFNPRYLIGIEIFHLPLEEVLFFVTVPFSCLFIYVLVRRFQTRDFPRPMLRGGLIALTLALFFLGFMNLDKVYTSVTFLSLAVFLFAHLFVFKSAYLGYFLQMFLISLLPFLIVNGILTNGLRFIDAGPVVWYNSADHLGIRVIGIPAEDFFYSMALLLGNVTLYENFLMKSEKR